MIPRKLLTTDEYLEIALRRIWWIIIPLVLAVAAAAAYAKLAPRIYIASITISVTPQKVPTDYVRPTITSKIEDRLHAISQEIMSRTQLEKIISEFGLYPREVNTLASEEVIELMRKDIIIKIAGKEGSFTLSYQGRDPVIVTKVVNRLSSLFVEENLRQREQQAQGTTEFLTLELNATREKLEEQEKILTDYKQKHLYELPERMATNLSMLNQLRQDQQRVSGALNSSLERKLVIQKQISEIQRQAAEMQKQTAEIKSAPPPPPNQEVTEEETPPQDTRSASASTPLGPADKSKQNVIPAAIQLEKMRGHLRELQGRYTEMHPDVIRTKKTIKEVEKTVAIELEKILAEAEKESASRIAPGPPEKMAEVDFNPEEILSAEMKGQLTVTEDEIQNLKNEESKIRAQITIYQNRVENAPLRELMLTNLSRGYETTKENYRKLLDKSVQAQQAENLEKRQKGEQFRIIDPARVPEKPIKPNILKILVAGLALGVFSGGGLAAFKEYTDRSFRDARDLEAALGLKVLANIPKVVSKSA